MQARLCRGGKLGDTMQQDLIDFRPTLVSCTISPARPMSHQWFVCVCVCVFVSCKPALETHERASFFKASPLNVGCALATFELALGCSRIALPSRRHEQTSSPVWTNLDRPPRRAIREETLVA